MKHPLISACVTTELLLQGFRNRDAFSCFSVPTVRLVFITTSKVKESAENRMYEKSRCLSEIDEDDLLGSGT